MCNVNNLQVALQLYAGMLQMKILYLKENYKITDNYESI